MAAFDISPAAAGAMAEFIHSGLKSRRRTRGGADIRKVARLLERLSTVDADDHITLELPDRDQYS